MMRPLWEPQQFLLTFFVGREESSGKADVRHKIFFSVLPCLTFVGGPPTLLLLGRGVQKLSLCSYGFHHIKSRARKALLLPTYSKYFSLPMQGKLSWNFERRATKRSTFVYIPDFAFFQIRRLTMFKAQIMGQFRTFCLLDEYSAPFSYCCGTEAEKGVGANIPPSPSVLSFLPRLIKFAERQQQRGGRME